jgi:hypothetical protein
VPLAEVSTPDHVDTVTTGIALYESRPATGRVR